MYKLILLIVIISQTVLYGQDYKSIIIPSEYPPNPSKISKRGDTIGLHARIAILGDNGLFTLGSKTIWLGQNLDILSEAQFPEYSFARQSPFFYEGAYYGYSDKRSENDVAFIKLGSSGNLLESVDYMADAINVGATASTMIGTHLYSAHATDFQDNRRETTIQKLDLGGNEVWSKTIDENRFYTYCYEMTPSLDGNLLISTDYFEGSSTYNQIIKIDLDGNEIWRYEDEADDITGSVAPFIATLSDGNILIKSLEDHGLDPIYSQNGWSPYPEHLIWISPDGEFIRDTLMPANHPADHNLFDVTAGNGDYFFGFGRWEDYETDIRYGWLFKMSNDGQMIWDKHYRHYPPNGDLERSSIEEIVELDNGDIVFAGIAENVTQGRTDLWVARINEHGCFGDSNCDDNMVTDIPEVEIEDVVNVYPNPSVNELKIEIQENWKESTIEILDISGRRAMYKRFNDQQNSIDITQLPKGIYIIQIVLSNGDTEMKKILKL